MEGQENNFGVEQFSGAISQAFASSPINNDEDIFSEESASEQQSEAPSTEASVNSSLSEENAVSNESENTDSEATTSENTETNVTETPSLSIEQVLAEKTGGKIKTLDDLEKLKDFNPDDYFVDDEVRRINELKKQGVALDENWFYLQTREFEKVDDPIEILAEAMKLENPELTDREIEYELKIKYQINQWAKEGEEEDDLSPERKEIEEIFSAKMLRDAEKKREELIALRDSRSVKQKINPEQKAKQIAEAEQKYKQWVDSIEGISNNTSKLTVNVSEKDAFDFLVDSNEKKEVSNIVKTLWKDSNAFWGQFVKDGNVDAKSIYETILKARNYEKAVASAYQRGLASGAEQEVKNIKNVNFKSDSAKPPTSMEDALAKAVAKGLLGI